MATRRDRRRTETVDNIKATARAQLADGGPTEISMRAIARHLDMTASAVHYYFPSRQALLQALIVDGFASLAEALRTAYDEVRSRPPADQWLGVCRAHRAWALRQPSEYQLLYGHNAGRIVAIGELHAFQAVVAVLFSIMRGAVAIDEIDTGRIEAGAPPSLRRQLAAWREGDANLADLPDGALAACLITYAQLHGAITLELLAHVPLPLSDCPALFDLEMTHAYAALCRRPARDRKA
ncbi:MAG: TetR/AcrR family transcriptional regulator [Actinomycetota bacterium]|nr:TetR/AcrR family transcriptional regulator [Actinomycetota bacterium]